MKLRTFILLDLSNSKKIINLFFKLFYLTKNVSLI